jgi:hypothetical protein
VISGLLFKLLERRIAAALMSRTSLQKVNRPFINLKKCNLEYAYLKVHKPVSNLFQSQWLLYFMKMFYCYLLRFWGAWLWLSRTTNVKRNLICYWTTKERIWQDSNTFVFPLLFLYLAKVISLFGHLPGSIFSHDSDIASSHTQLVITCVKSPSSDNSYSVHVKSHLYLTIVYWYRSVMEIYNTRDI